MEKRSINRLLSLLCAAVIIIGLMPGFALPVWAVDGTGGGTDSANEPNPSYIPDDPTAPDVTTTSLSGGTMEAMDTVLVSVIAPAAVTGVANGTEKTADALGLLSDITLVTDGGDVQASVNWDVDSSAYDPFLAVEQTFTVNGIITLPSGVTNPNDVSLDVAVSVTVYAATPVEKVSATPVQDESPLPVGLFETMDAPIVTLGSGDASVTTYEELKAALSSAGSGDTITVTQDILCIELDGSKTLMMPSGATLKIISGVTLTVSYNVSFQNMGGDIAIEGTLCTEKKYGGNGNIVNGSTFTIASGGQFINGGSFQHFGTLTNNGAMTNQSGFFSTGLGTITNNGTFTNDGNLENANTMTNYGVFTNNGDIANTGTIMNKSTGTIANNGTVDNSDGGALINQGGSVSFYPRLVRTQTTVSGYAGRVGDKTFTATLSNSFPELITFMASVSGLSATASRTGDGTVSAVSPGDDLNQLSAGTYDVTMRSDATECNAAIGSTLICSLVISKTFPSISGTNVISGTVGAMSDQTITATLTNCFPEDVTMQAYVDGMDIEETFVHSTGNGTVSFDLAAEDLNTLTPGSYPIKISSLASASNYAMSSKTIGTLTLSAATPVVTGSNDISGTVLSLGPHTVTASVTGSYPEAMEYTAHIAGYSVSASRTGDGDIAFPFTADMLNALTSGSYPITVTAFQTVCNAAVAATPIGTVTVSPKSPVVTGSNDMTGTISRVGSKTVSVVLNNTYPEEITLTAHLAGIDISAATTGDGPVSFEFPEEQLDSLAVGAYPVTVTAKATENNTAILPVSIGSLTVSKATPHMAGHNNLIVLDGMVAEQTAIAALTECFLEPVTLTANAGGIHIPVIVNENGPVSFVFSAGDLATLPQGDYSITVTSEETAGNNAISASIGTLSVVEPHTLVLKFGAGGKITGGSSGYYGKGMEIVIQAKPDTGYKLDKWTSTAGSFMNVRKSSATFVMPDQDVTVSALFKKVAATLSITTSALQDGVVGEAYSQALTATGSVPITWRFHSGSLPEGLVLSKGGTLSGIPAANGIFSFTVKAENGEDSDTKTLRMIVREANAMNKTLIHIITPAAITGVANGTVKTFAALGLPAMVTLATDGGTMQGRVAWDMASCTYDPAFSGAQAFTVDGSVSLPAGVCNPKGVGLTISISVSVDAAPQPPLESYVPDQYIVDEGDRVTVDLTRGSSIVSAEQCGILIDLNKDKNVVLSGEGYTLTFPAGSFTGDMRGYDFGIRFNTGEHYEVIRSLTGDNFVLMLDFYHSGALPGEAQIRILVGTQYAEQTLIYQYFSPSTGELDFMQEAAVDADGYAVVTQSHCSAYVLSLADDANAGGETLADTSNDHSVLRIWWVPCCAVVVGIAGWIILRKTRIPHKR